MAAANVTIKLMDPFVRRELVEKILDKDQPLHLEERVYALGQLAVTTVIHAASALSRSNYKAFDPNPGDSGCQIRACRNWMLMNEGRIQQEFDRLSVACKKAKRLFEQRLSQSRVKKLEKSALEFLDETLKEVTLTKDQAYLIQCHLLAVLRAPKRDEKNKIVIDENGFLKTITDPSFLTKYSHKIVCLGDFQATLVNEMQTVFSLESFQFIKAELEKVTLFSPAEMSVAREGLLAPKEVKTEGFSPKFVGMLFFEMKVMLTRLLEERAILVFKSIADGVNQPFYLFYKAVREGREFERLSDARAERLELTRPLVVVEGKSPLGKEGCAKLFQQIGFKQTLIALSSLKPPFDEKSLLAEVSEKPKEEICATLRLTEKLELSHQLIIDHLYCTTRMQEFNLPARRMNMEKESELEMKEEQKEPPGEKR